MMALSAGLHGIVRDTGSCSAQFIVGAAPGRDWNIFAVTLLAARGRSNGVNDQPSL
jgi:hypothetical protein